MNDQPWNTQFPSYNQIHRRSFLYMQTYQLHYVPASTVADNVIILCAGKHSSGHSFPLRYLVYNSIFLIYDVYDCIFLLYHVYHDIFLTCHVYHCIFVICHVYHGIFLIYHVYHCIYEYP